MNEILPCDNSKALDQLLIDGYERGTELCRAEQDCGREQAEVSMSKLESLLLMDSTAGSELAGCVTGDTHQLESDSVSDETLVTQFDCIDEEPATVSQYDDGDEDSTSGEKSIVCLL